MIAKGYAGLWQTHSFHWQTSREEYLCDHSCFDLDLVCLFPELALTEFDVSIASFSQQEQDSDVIAQTLDPSVENMINYLFRNPMSMNSNFSDIFMPPYDSVFSVLISLLCRHLHTHLCHLWTFYNSLMYPFCNMLGAEVTSHFPVDSSIFFP